MSKWDWLETIVRSVVLGVVIGLVIACGWRYLHPIDKPDEPLPEYTSYDLESITDQLDRIEAAQNELLEKLDQLDAAEPDIDLSGIDEDAAIMEDGDVPDDPMWKIVYYESRGVIDSENGPYKGLFQLHEDWFAALGGTTWESCRYDAQEQIRIACMYAKLRYGTWQKAAIWRDKHNWW